MFSHGDSHSWVVILDPSVYCGIQGSQCWLVVCVCPHLLPWTWESIARIPNPIKCLSNVFIVMVEGNLVLRSPKCLGHLSIGVVSWILAPIKWYSCWLWLLLLLRDVHTHVISYAFLCVESPWVVTCLFRYFQLFLHLCKLFYFDGLRALPLLVNYLICACTNSGIFRRIDWWVKLRWLQFVHHA